MESHWHIYLALAFLCLLFNDIQFNALFLTKHQLPLIEVKHQEEMSASTLHSPACCAASHQKILSRTVPHAICPGLLSTLPVPTTAS